MNLRWIGWMVSAALSGVLGGCATPEMIWQQAGIPAPQAQQDQARCSYQVELAAGAPVHLTAEQTAVRNDYRDALYSHCMKAMGYQQVPDPVLASRDVGE